MKQQNNLKLSFIIKTKNGRRLIEPTKQRNNFKLFRHENEESKKAGEEGRTVLFCAFSGTGLVRSPRDDWVRELTLELWLLAIDSRLRERSVLLLDFSRLPFTFIFSPIHRRVD